MHKASVYQHSIRVDEYAELEIGYSNTYIYNRYSSI